MSRTFTAESITKDLVEGGICVIHGVGKFRVVTRPERDGHNPATGEKLRIPAKRVVRFSPSKTIMDKLK